MKRKTIFGVAFFVTFYTGMIAGRQVFIKALKIQLPAIVGEATNDMTPQEQMAFRQAVIKLSDTLRTINRK
jgi:uncharacterized membrane protein